jgi:hypothetical protein
LSTDNNDDKSPPPFEIAEDNVEFDECDNVDLSVSRQMKTPSPKKQEEQQPHRKRKHSHQVRFYSF